MLNGKIFIALNYSLGEKSVLQNEEIKCRKMFSTSYQCRVRKKKSADFSSISSTSNRNIPLQSLSRSVENISELHFFLALIKKNLATANRNCASLILKCFNFIHRALSTLSWCDRSRRRKTYKEKLIGKLWKFNAILIRFRFKTGSILWNIV